MMRTRGTTRPHPDSPPDEFDTAVRSLLAERRRRMPDDYRNPPRDLLAEIKALRQMDRRADDGAVGDLRIFLATLTLALDAAAVHLAIATKFGGLL